MTEPDWSEWQPLAGAPALTADVLAETLDGGQAFRWNRVGDRIWLGQWAGLFFFRDAETGVERFEHRSQAAHWRKI